VESVDQIGGAGGVSGIAEYRGDAMMQGLVVGVDRDGALQPREGLVTLAVLGERGASVDDGAAGLFAGRGEPGPGVVCGELPSVQLDDVAAGVVLGGGADGVGQRVDGGTPWLQVGADGVGVESIVVMAAGDGVFSERRP
jgi:hypothetical protein